ncbi:uncharacterized protein LTR77_010228 [Saxophila tyrrhenica]|uniref:Mitochondrial pyruvate carrier n=1 Tax=Saxophila tyrrhenica TaxID=1690608 RepID=A0AAV9NW98_9PEZI|nr:hypothetical protein LTR77_010228 [Saxophila tyrrhenica]
MAAAIKALNARIRANPVTDYFCSTRESSLECDGVMCEIGGEEMAIPSAWDGTTRAKHLLTHFTSTDFWGPASNFGIPIAAVMDTSKDPDIISGRMTAALAGYSGVFMRYSMAVTPKNYLLFGCHIVNFSAQMTQGYRFVDYWYMGGREKSLQAKADQGLDKAEGEIKEGAEKVTQEANDMAGKVEGMADQAKEKVQQAVGR